MEQAEQGLKELRAEAPAHKFVPMMAGTQPVTMPETESLPRDIHDIRLLENDDSHLLEIMIAPDVMVPLKEIHFHAIVHEVHQRSEHTHITLRHDIMILIPEIPDVTQHIERRRTVPRYRIKE